MHLLFGSGNIAKTGVESLISLTDRFRDLRFEQQNGEWIAAAPVVLHDGLGGNCLEIFQQRHAI